MAVLSMVLLVAAMAGCAFLLAATLMVRSFLRREKIAFADAPSVTILKPLHGDEPGLFDNLASFCRQDYSGPVQIVFGVRHANDPAVGVVERLCAAHPGRQLDLVIDPCVAGANPKVANLINMSARIRHDIVVLADSDIRVAPDYLAQVVGTLQPMGQGAVTCPYFGISNGSRWSDFARLSLDTHFLPGVVLGARIGLAHPCMGSTIAMRRTSLEAIGGFEAVADCLADDYELGNALRRCGENVALIPYAVGHLCHETSFGMLWRHELRWARTIRTVDPLGYIGWLLTHPFALALAALPFGGGVPALGLALAALTGRAVLTAVVERGCGLPPHPYWLIPVRDLLSFSVFVAGLFGRDVDWQGRRYRLVSKGTLASERKGH